MLYKWAGQAYISRRASSATWPRARAAIRSPCATSRLTHRWWNTQRERYALYTSTEVLAEAAVGDPPTAQRRLDLLSSLPLVSRREDADELAELLQSGVPLPPRAKADALHIALAAVYGTRYVLTWNCKHIANPRLWPRMERVCSARGIEMPVLCTPHYLLGG